MPNSTQWGLRMDPQPRRASLQRIVKELESAGTPVLGSSTLALTTRQDELDQLEELLDALVLVEALIDTQGFATLSRGSARPVLLERGWRTFLLRVQNPHALTEHLHARANPIPGFRQAPAPGEFTEGLGLAQVPWNIDRIDKTGLVYDSWLRIELGDHGPLSGLPEEYRLFHVYCSGRQARTARIGFSASLDSLGLHSGNQSIQFDFDVEPSFDVTFDIRDDTDETCVASLVIRDQMGRIYPPQAMRVAPDMRFHPQIYRGHGETIRLPAGLYQIEARRGPEYLSSSTSVDVQGANSTASIRLKRWIKAEAHGWYSSDPHIHAAGCSHYLVPTEGVRPESMIRQVRGEGLSLGSVLTWGPGYYHQKQFFSGEAISPDAVLEYPEMQAANNQAFSTQVTDQDQSSALRYDLEVSGFPSSHLGHLMLLNLADQDYPGTRLLEDWPSYTLPIAKWGREQGALIGFAHCGFGLDVASMELPNYDMPAFNSIGLNEAIVDVTHDAVDFVAGAEALPAMELNAWYHILNSGFELSMIGETDYPCIFDERPGVGRTYVAMDSPMDGGAGYPQWVEGVRAGNLYFGDGRSHFLHFDVNGASSGASLELPEAAQVTLRVSAAAFLDEHVSQESRRIRESPEYARPSWHLERARIENSRNVPLEIVVNGQAVKTVDFPADGDTQELTFTLELSQSSWVALRILPSSHTNPVFIRVAGQPIRASRRSAQWCRDAVDVLWNEKARFIRAEERVEAEAAFDFARRRYEQISNECQEPT